MTDFEKNQARVSSLSSVDLRWADLSSADLRTANLSRADLRTADLRSADLRQANLQGANLYSADLRGANLRGANLNSANLRSADLRGANLQGVDLSLANLRGCVFDTENVPQIPEIHVRLWEAIETANHQLDMTYWHSCDTTHCRAGWVVHLAGAAGYALERQIGPNAAAALIYQLSDPALERLPNFFASDFDAMEDIRTTAKNNQPPGEQNQ